MVTKETRFGAGHGLPWWLKVGVAIAAVASFQPFVAFALERTSFTPTWSMRELQYYSTWMGCLITALLFLSLAVRGANVYHSEVGRNTWESLVATPLRSWDILNGWFLGCIVGLKWVYLWLACFCLAAVYCGATHFLAFPTLAVAVAAYSPYFAWVGIRMSLAAETPLRSSIQAVTACLLTNFGMLSLSCLLALGVFPLFYAGMGLIGGAWAGGALGSLNPMIAAGLLLGSMERGDDSKWGALVLLALPACAAGFYAWYWLAVRSRVKCLELFNERANRDLAYPSHVFHLRTRDLRYNRGVGTEEGGNESGPPI